MRGPWLILRTYSQRIWFATIFGGFSFNSFSFVLYCTKHYSWYCFGFWQEINKKIPGAWPQSGTIPCNFDKRTCWYHWCWQRLNCNGTHPLSIAVSCDDPDFETMLLYFDGLGWSPCTLDFWVTWLNSRALPDITSGPEVWRIFKVRTVRKPDFFLPGLRTFNSQ